MKKQFLIILISLFLLPVFFVDAAGYLTGSNVYDAESCARAYGTWNSTKTISNGACSCSAPREPSGGICDCAYPYYSKDGGKTCVELKKDASGQISESYSKVTSENSRVVSIRCKSIPKVSIGAQNSVTDSDYTVPPIVQGDGSLKCPDGFTSSEVTDYNNSIGSTTKSSSSSSSSGSSSSGSSSTYSTGYTVVPTPGTTMTSKPSVSVKYGPISMPQITGSMSISNPLAATSFNELLQRLLDWILNMAMVIAPLIIVYAGFLHVTAMGQIEKINKARNIILYASIGFIVALMAKSLVALFVDLVVK